MLAQWGKDLMIDCGGRAVASANIHLTLSFVGDVEREHIARLEGAARSVHAAPFALTVDRIGYFRFNRIVWAGTAHCPPPLTALETRLRAALAPLGMKAEDRPYVPHITLVRQAQRKPSLCTPQACVWRVEEFVLMESVAIAGGVRYEPLARWPLIMPR
jgi:RNA 2',3'-cyclic 3'-phosphodiesterase